jgi:hypothetical protein
VGSLRARPAAERHHARVVPLRSDPLHPGWQVLVDAVCAAAIITDSGGEAPFGGPWVQPSSARATIAAPSTPVGSVP